MARLARGAPQGTRSLTQEHDWVLGCGERYWGGHADALRVLPVPRTEAPATSALTLVELPAWAADVGVEGRLLVDSGCVVPGEREAWRRCDWWTAAFRHLTGAVERRHEAVHGPVHSYAVRLRGVDRRLFDAAWANRIFLFLRRSAARAAGSAEEPLFGPLPAARFDLSHDVDALEKTPELRLKQAAFQLLSAGRLAAHGRVAAARARTAGGLRFAARGGPLRTFDELRTLEERHGVRSVFHVYAGPPGRSRRGSARLFDPAYDVRSLATELAALRESGWEIGLHPGYQTWRDPHGLRAAREALERVAGAPVKRCRQHWLRFSWAETWAAQEQAGLGLDSSLGFNDRPAFRNGSALRIRPWNSDTRAPRTLSVLPMVLMDSHLYDYDPLLDGEGRRQVMRRWIGEVAAVRGEASFLWHPHTMHPDYGWAPGYVDLLDIIDAAR